MSVTTNTIGKTIIRAANGIVNFAILAAILLLVVFACYALWDSEQLYQAADAAQYEVYKPRAEDEGQSFEDLRALNLDVFAWLTVYGTNIDYPVTQGEDNMTYINTNAMGDYSLSGSIFLDSGNRQDFSDFNSIFYGHHMEKQTMFGELGLFSEPDYFQERPYGNLYYDGQNHGLEFFAFLHTDAYDTSVFLPGVQGRDAQQTYLDNLLNKANYTREIGVTIEDHIVLLSTCSSASTNGRDILVGRITDRLYDDTFTSTDMDNGAQAAADRQPGPWADYSLWLCVALLGLGIMVASIVLHHIQQRHKHF